MAKKKVWEDLSTPEQRTLLDNLGDDELAKRYDKTADYFGQARKFFAAIPRQTVDPKAMPHSPPKDLVISARRDLSFFEANFELFDNSIDKWRTDGAKRNVQITVDYDLELLTGIFADDAGGMDERDVYKVFIPGETTNRDFKQNVIGSFGMGAKKGIFRLTDGAKIVSCRSTKFSATSEVPQQWELSPNWETMDGRAESIGEGKTQIYLFKLFAPPSQEDIEELIHRTGVVYRPLLKGDFLPRKVKIKVNGVDVEPGPSINWSNPAGAGPRYYKLSHTFTNFLETGENILLDFEFRCGLTRKLPGQGEDVQPDWGVDVYGNGRVIEQFLKEEFGFGTAGLGTTTQGHKFFRAELFISGHSFAIPWDTHKREYMRDHPVSAWLRKHLRPIIKAYVDIGRKFADGDNTEIRRTELAATAVEDAAKIPVHKVSTTTQIAASVLPKWSFPSKPKQKKKETAPVTNNGSRPATKAKLSEPDQDEHPVTLSLDSAEYDDLSDRFGAADEEELATAITDCLVSGVAFSLEAPALRKALKVFKCDGDTGQLSNTVKEQLLKKLASS